MLVRPFLFVAFMAAVPLSSAAFVPASWSVSYTVAPNGNEALTAVPPVLATACPGSWALDSDIASSSLQSSTTLDVSHFLMNDGSSRVWYSFGTPDVLRSVGIVCAREVATGGDVLTTPFPTIPGISGWHELASSPAMTAPRDTSATRTFTSSDACVRVVFDPAQLSSMGTPAFTGFATARVTSPAGDRAMSAGSYVVGIGPFDTPRNYTFAHNEPDQIATARVGPAWCDGPTTATLTAGVANIRDFPAMGGWIFRVQGCTVSC